MFKTKMTELFGIQHPIMLAGMNWITEPGLGGPGPKHGRDIYGHMVLADQREPGS